MKKSNVTSSRIFSFVDLGILTCILVIAFVFRLYKLSTPLADLHSWRQADTSAVTRNYVKWGIDFLHPRYDDLSSNQTGLENPQGYRYVEFPIYNAIVATAYKFLPLFTIEVYGRLVSIFFSLLIIGVIYYLGLKESDRVTAIIGSLVYAIFPFFVFFSRAVLPETTSLSFAVLSIFFLYLFAERKNKLANISWYIVSLIAFIVALLLKPPAVFYGIALLFIFMKKYGWGLIKKPGFYAYFILAAIPLLIWRYYMRQFPEGIPPNDWLITSVNTYQGLQNIFFRPAFFRWVFFERINNFILGGYLTFFWVLGILAKPKKTILVGMLLSALAYLLVFQGGNVQHEYYQTFILPAIALFIGLGVSFIVGSRTNFLHPLLAYPIIAIVFGLSFFFSFYNVRNYYNYPPELPQIANIVKTLTKEDDKIVTDRSGDTTLLYLTERRGAPSIYKEPPELKKLGYKYLITLHSELIQKLKEEKYRVVFENNAFAMFEL